MAPIMDQLKTFLGFKAPTKVALEANASSPQESRMPAAITHFVNATSTPGLDQDWLMGSLKDQGINPYDFAKWCGSFARGVAYVYQRFGTCPSGIMIIDMEPGKSTYYNADNKTIFISREWIGRSISNYLSIQGKTDPHVLFAEQQALAYGVEEAYHHYQFSSDPAHYSALMQNYTPYLTGKVATDGSHDLHPLEAEAKVIVQDAMKAFRLDRMPIAPVHDAAWQARIKAGQATQQASPPTEGTPIKAR